MVERAKTKDEMFVLKLNELALKEGGAEALFEASFDRYTIGTLIGIHATAVDTICNLLAQANFIKKRGKIEVSITPQGIRLVEDIHESARLKKK